MKEKEREERGGWKGSREEDGKGEKSKRSGLGRSDGSVDRI